MATKHPSSRRYPSEVKQRAVQLVLKTMEQNGERHGVVSRIARQLDVGPETLRHWVRQAEIDRGTRANVQHHPEHDTHRCPRQESNLRTRFRKRRVGGCPPLSDPSDSSRICS